MVKKILTTKAHLVVLFLGLLNLLIPSIGLWGTSESGIHRTIGWGWDLSKYVWFYDGYLNILWVIVFPIVYWLVGRKLSLSFPLMLLQIIVIVLLISARQIDPLFRVYLELANWILFFINVTIALLNGKR